MKLKGNGWEVNGKWMGKRLENGWVTAGKWMGNRWEMEGDSLEGDITLDELQ